MTALDDAGMPLRLDGMILRADGTRFDLRCKTSAVGLLPGQSTPEILIPPPACDGSSQTILWSQVRQMDVRRARAASGDRTLVNGVGGAVAAGLFGALVGAASAVIIDVTLTDYEDANSDSHLKVWSSHVRYGAIAGGGLGVVSGGIATIVWSRGVWVRVPLPDRE